MGPKDALVMTVEIAVGGHGHATIVLRVRRISKEVLLINKISFTYVSFGLAPHLCRGLPQRVGDRGSVAPRPHPARREPAGRLAGAGSGGAAVRAHAQGNGAHPTRTGALHAGCRAPR